MLNEDNNVEDDNIENNKIIENVKSGWDKTEKPFLTKKTGFFKNKKEEVKELNEYVLLLMKNIGETDIIEGVRPGEFLLKSANGQEEKTIYLTANKITNFNYNGQKFRGWVAHEDSFTPYPQDPLHSAEMYRKTTQRMAMNYRDVNEAKFLEAKTKMYLYIGFGIIIFLYVLYILLKNAGVINMGGTPEKVVANTTETVVRNLTRTI